MELNVYLSYLGDETRIGPMESVISSQDTAEIEAARRGAWRMIADIVADLSVDQRESAVIKIKIR